jgi:hypothetical protein
MLRVWIEVDPYYLHYSNEEIYIFEEELDLLVEIYLAGDFHAIHHLSTLAGCF